MNEIRYEVRPIGWVASPVVERADAPPQGDEGAPDAWITLRADLQPALGGLAVGDRIIILTWLDRADRDVLQVHARGDLQRPLAGVFTTRAPDRPNPIGLHEVSVLGIDGTTLHVSGLEVIDGTPVVDLKPVLGSVHER